MPQYIRWYSNGSEGLIITVELRSTAAAAVAADLHVARQPQQTRYLRLLPATQLPSDSGTRPTAFVCLTYQTAR